ncbi:hypothetical protein BS78_05G266500 [Paspalum vaginatum]|nr:hypothetical protein BS78_05G266500 [Paspalum vaginatum]
MDDGPVSVSLGVVLSLPAKLGLLLLPEAGHGLRKGDKSKIRLLKDQFQELIDKYLMEPSEVDAPVAVLGEGGARALIRGLHQNQKNLHGRISRLREGLKQSRWVTGETSRFCTRLEEAIQRHKRYNLDRRQSRRRPIMVEDSDDELPIPPPCLVGIDSSMEKLEDLRVVSIVGLGGIGKTTLAGELYRKLGRQFECRAFVRSSQKPDLKGLLTSILLQVRPRHRRRLLPDKLELGNLVDAIRAHLQHKKYFIVIDDLWASSTWDIIYRAFPDDRCFSRVLTTTEINITAQRCSGHNSKHIFPMQPLSHDESRKLFFNKVLGNQSRSHHDQLCDVSSIIGRKCGGFPLATVTIANLFARLRNGVEHCNYIRRSLSSNLRANPTTEGIKQVLSLCYEYLPNHLKACLLYLSIYKEGHIIWKHDLVKQWIAEGFICAKEGKHMDKVAGNYFDELVNVGMIQPVDLNCIGEVLSCTVHYMVFNLIRYRSVEENFVTSIDHSQTNTRLADKNMRLSQVRSFALFGLVKTLPSIAEFRLLRILILHLWNGQDNISFDPTAVCKLIELRYLEVVCNVTINLGTEMQVSPDIVHLPDLLHLNLPGNAVLPDGFGRMSSIRELGCFDLSNNSADNVLSLGNLTNLQDLCLTCSTMPADNLEKKLQCLGSTLSKLQSLKSLTMLPADFFHENTLKASALSNIISLDDLSILSSPPSLLQKLELPRICTFSILPEWIGKLCQLSILNIQVVGLSGDDVDILKGLPALAALSLFVRTATAQRIYLKVICPELCIAFMKGAMPNVRRLKLSFDADTMVKYNPVISGLEHLTGLEDISAKIGSPAADEALLNGMFWSIKWVNWSFFGERSTDLQMEKHQTTENRNPNPDVNIKGDSDAHYGIGDKGLWKDRNKQADSRFRSLFVAAASVLGSALRSHPRLGLVHVDLLLCCASICWALLRFPRGREKLLLVWMQTTRWKTKEKTTCCIDGTFYICLEYVNPGSIEKYIQQHCGLLSESVIRSFMPHILKGLALLHSQKIMHR